MRGEKKERGQERTVPNARGKRAHHERPFRSTGTTKIHQQDGVLSKSRGLESKEKQSRNEHSKEQTRLCCRSCVGVTRSPLFEANVLSQEKFFFKCFWGLFCGFL